MAPALHRSNPDSGSFLADLKTSSYRALNDPDEPNRSDGFKNRTENIVGDEVNDKIQKTLNLLTLRDPCHLIQFWSPCSIGKYTLIKTVDQPFGLGIRDERLCNYRRESEHKWFHVDDEECKEQDLVPVVRVFKRRLPEWSSDVTNYSSKNHPLRDCAIRLNLHGYLVLPVFDSRTMLCVGVLESITSSTFLDCAYEVQQVHRTLQEVNLTSPKAFDSPTYYAQEFKNTQHELDEIFKVLKDCCLTHNLPLAQTWKASSTSSFVATERSIERACSSFNSTCIGEVCMSTTGLPFCVHDLRVWPFREACREHHLLKPNSVVGRALSSHGSCFCADVTKLGEDEYSLVHNARMSGLTSCLAIYLHSKEHDDSYVLELFLPVDMKETADLQNLVQKLNLHIKSSFEFGDLLTTEVIQIDSKDSQTVGQSNARNDCINALDQHDFSNDFLKNQGSAVTNTGVCVDDATSKNIDLVTEEKGAPRKHEKQHKTDDRVSAHIQKYHGSLSREIVQLDTETVEKTNIQTDCPNAQDQLSVDDVSYKNIDVVTAEKGACTKRKRKRKMDSITLDNIKQYFGKPIGEASTKLGVSRSTLKRVCREFNIASWPVPNRNKKTVHFGISVAVFLLVRVKRWSCSSNHHGFSGRWWICGMHNSFVSRSHTSLEGATIRGLLSFSHPLKDVKETDESTVTTFSKHVDGKISDTFDVFHALASPKKSVLKVLDNCRMVTVKATYKDDMIKFRMPISSGLLELENQVAQRIKLKNTKLHLKYRDEDDDLILIACDADFHNLMFSATSLGNQTIKLIVQIAKK